MDGLKAVAWRVRGPRGGWMHSDKLPSSWRNAEPLYAHPAPIKTSADTGELRDDVLERLRALDFAGHYDEAQFQHTADAILDLIQSERAG